MDERVALLGHVDEVGDGLLLVAVVGRHDEGDVVHLVRSHRQEDVHGTAVLPAPLDVQRVGLRHLIVVTSY